MEIVPANSIAHGIPNLYGNADKQRA